MEKDKTAPDDTSDYYGSLKGEDCMLDSIVQKAADNFIEEIKKSNIYREYDFQKENLKRQPELFDKVTEFRQKNYALQTETPAEELLDRLDAFEREYEEFRSHPLVDDFLRAELAFCRMMQEVNVLITAELDFE